MDVIDQSVPDDVAELPTTGSASYVGTIAVEDATGLIAAGALSLNAAFASASVTGEVTGLVDDDDAPLSGDLTIENGEIGGSENYAFVADITGTLTSAEDNIVGVNGEILGSFFQDQGYVSGDLQGDYTLNGGSLTTFSGEFVAQQ